MFAFAYCIPNVCSAGSTRCGSFSLFTAVQLSVMFGLILPPTTLNVIDASSSPDIRIVLPSALTFEWAEFALSLNTM